MGNPRHKKSKRGLEKSLAKDKPPIKFSKTRVLFRIIKLLRIKR